MKCKSKLDMNGPNKLTLNDYDENNDGDLDVKGLSIIPVTITDTDTQPSGET
jgi:hypothetical protein